MAGKKDLSNIQQKQILAKRLASAVKDLHDIYCEVTEDEFMSLFEMIGGKELMIGPIVDAVRFFDPEAKRFKLPRFMETYRLDQSYQRWGAFHRALDNFKSGIKGSDGGLKSFRKEFLEIKEEHILTIKEYKELISLDKDKLSKKQNSRLLMLGEKIPEAITKKVRSTGTRKLALKWMTKDYPCTLNTLKQIMSRQPKIK